jgi:hypothetical protein
MHLGIVKRGRGCPTHPIHKIAVKVEDLPRPDHLVSDPLSRRLGVAPEFEVLWTVVRPDTVEVMDLLGAQQGASDQSLHDDAVLASLPAVGGDQQIAI